MSELDVLFVVEELELPDSQVVAPPVYPPSIAVLDPETLVCVEPAQTVVEHTNSIKNNNVDRYFTVPPRNNSFYLFQLVSHF